MDELGFPCGLGDEYDSCCRRIRSGALAATTKQLVHSRYSASAVGDTACLLRTWHSSGRPHVLRLDPVLPWTRLAVLETHDGGLFDTAARCGSAPCTSMTGGEASRRRRAGSSGRTGWAYLGRVD